jgi:AraC-like DNA-binding protein
VAAEVGIDLGLFEDPDNSIPFVAIGRLLQECVARSGCPHYGLLVGERSAASSLGVVSDLMRHSPDVATALRNLVLYLQLQDRGAVPTLEVQGETVLLGYAVYQKGVVATDQIYDAAIAIGFNILRSLCGPRFRPSEVLLRRAEPVDREPYRRLFNAPVRFDSYQSALVFPKTWLDRPVSGADPHQYRTLDAAAKALMERLDVDFVDQLHRVLHGLVITGWGSVEQAAFLFGMHRRTLNRRLAAQGTSFRALLQEVRFEIAQQLLRDTRIPVADVAEALGYAAAGAFTRAFQRWSGQSPTAWRAGLQRD